MHCFSNLHPMEAPIAQFKIKILPLIFLVAVALPPAAFGWDNGRGSLHWYWNTEIGSHTDDLSELMKAYNSLQIKGTYVLSSTISCFATIKKFYDSVYDIAGEYRAGSHKTAKDTGTMWLREVFLDYDHKPLFVRIGKQQVVWGSSDGVRALDSINPGDSRYAYLDDAADYRIPLWMLRLEASMKTDATLQVLVIPDYEPHYSADAGDVFVFRPAKLSAKRLEGLPSFITVKEKRRYPPSSLHNSTVALRWQQVLEGWEITLNYKYGYEFYPQAQGGFKLRDGRIPTVLLEKDFRKHINIFGASFTKAIPTGALRGFTFRGEFLCTRGKPYPYGKQGSVVGNTSMTAYAAILGLDKIFFTDTLISMQLVQFLHPRTTCKGQDIFYLPTFAPLRRSETMMTFRVSTDFFAERLKPEMLVIGDEHRDWRLSPKISYEVNNHLWVYAGLHLFSGPRDSFYGQFKDDKMIYVGQTMSF